MPPAKLCCFSKTGILGKGWGKTGVSYRRELAAFLQALVVGHFPVWERAREALRCPDLSCSVRPLDAPASHAVCWAVPAAAGRRDKAEAKPKEKMESVLCQGFWQKVSPL